MAFFPNLAGLFYAEFDPIQGPKIVAETGGLLRDTPRAHLNGPLHMHASEAELPQSSHVKSAELLLDFDSISEYIIPKASLCNHVVTVVSNFSVLGYPQIIQSQQYSRNAFIFNLCFVFASNADTRPYTPLVRKLGRILRSLEAESSFLSTEDKAPRILSLLERIWDELNSFFECGVGVDPANAINLKLFPRYPPPPVVHEHQVPVLVADIIGFSGGRSVVDKYWDLTVRKIVPHLSHLYPIKKLATVSGVDLELTKLAVGHLLYYGVCRMVDIFKFSNIYSTTSKLGDFYNSPHLQTQCQRFVSRTDDVPLTTLFTLYAAMTQATPINTFIHMHSATIVLYRIDIRRFVLFGVLHEFLRRVHKYPILRQNTGDDKNQTNKPEGELGEFLIRPNWRRFCDGMTSLNMICCETGKSATEVVEALGNVDWILK